MSVNKPGLAKSSQALTFAKNTQGKKTSLVSAYRDGTAANPRSTVTVNLRNTQSRVEVFTSSGARVMLNGGQTSLRNVNPMLVRNDNSALRAGLNPNRGYDIKYMKDMQKWWAANQGTHHCNSDGMSGWQKTMIAMSAINQLAQTFADVTTDKAGKSSSTTAAANPSSTESVSNKAIVSSSSTKISNSTTGTISGMSKAKDSSTLRGAIESAENAKASMQAELASLKEQIPSLKEAANDVKEDLAKLNEEVKTKEKAVSEQKADLSQKESNYKDAEKTLAKQNEAFNTACNNLKAANNRLGIAEGNLSTAKEAFTAAQNNIDPNTGAPVQPAYSQAEAAYEKAEAAFRQAQADVDKAENAKQQAAGSLEDAKANKESTKKWYLESKQNYEAAKESYETSKKELDTMKGKQAEMQAKVDAYENAVKQQTQLINDIAALDSEIPTQKTRLAELEKKESDGLENAVNTILKMESKMSGKDGILDTDDDKKLGSKNKAKYNEALDLRRNVNYSKLAQTNGETLGGTTFRKASYDGETLYMIGMKAVTADEYNKAYQSAGGILPTDMQNTYDNLGILRTMMDDTAFA